MEYLMAMQFVGDNDLLATQSDTPTNQPIQQPQAVGMPIPQSLSGGVEAGSYEPISEEIQLPKSGGGEEVEMNAEDTEEQP